MVVDLNVALQRPDKRVWFLHGEGESHAREGAHRSQWPESRSRDPFRYTFVGAEPSWYLCMASRLYRPKDADDRRDHCPNPVYL